MPPLESVEHESELDYPSLLLTEMDYTNFKPICVYTVALCSGGCLHIVSSDRAADPQALADYFHRHPIDCLKIVPSHLKALLTCKLTPL